MRIENSMAVENILTLVQEKELCEFSHSLWQKPQGIQGKGCSSIYKQRHVIFFILHMLYKLTM